MSQGSGVVTATGIGHAGDAAVVGRLAAGDAEALASLYDRYARLVYSLALRILEDTAEAEEVVQDVFSQAWTQASRYDAARAPVAAWLLMMARSRAIDRRRSRRAAPVAAAELPDVRDEAPAPDAQALTAEQVTRLKRALGELPLAQRLAIELAYYGGMTQSEIADRLEQPIGTIKTRIRLGLRRLREALQE
jgi:RNA polymerase sigma-70 factor (ECF subfamily)